MWAGRAWEGKEKLLGARVGKVGLGPAHHCGTLGCGKLTPYSQDHGLVWVGKTLKIISFQTPAMGITSHPFLPKPTRPRPIPKQTLIEERVDEMNPLKPLPRSQFCASPGKSSISFLLAAPRLSASPR